MNNFFSRIWRKIWHTSGWVYYVKVKTTNGPLYKIGFTENEALPDDLGDKNAIDKVILISYSDKAYSIEQKFHKHFRNKFSLCQNGNDHKGPLFPNGQGKFYASDVLGLDEALYEKESAILREAAEEDAGNFPLLMMILVGIVGVPLGGWGILVLLGVGIWYFSDSWNESDKKIQEAGANRRPKHPSHIQKLLELLRR